MMGKQGVCQKELQDTRRGRGSSLFCQRSHTSSTRCLLSSQDQQAMEICRAESNGESSGRDAELIDDSGGKTQLAVLRDVHNIDKVSFSLLSVVVF